MALSKFKPSVVQYDSLLKSSHCGTLNNFGKYLLPYLLYLETINK